MGILNTLGLSLSRAATRTYDGISWQGVGHERGADWGADLRAELLHFPHGRYKDRADQLSQYLNWRIMNALPAGVLRLEREGEQARVPLGEQSRRVSAAIAGKAYAAF